MITHTSLLNTILAISNESSNSYKYKNILIVQI